MKFYSNGKGTHARVKAPNLPLKTSANRKAEIILISAFLKIC
jgi:hypothetical protein